MGYGFEPGYLCFTLVNVWLNQSLNEKQFFHHLLCCNTLVFYFPAFILMVKIEDNKGRFIPIIINIT